MRVMEELCVFLNNVIVAGKENEVEKLTVTFQQSNGSTPLNHAVTVTYRAPDHELLQGVDKR